MRPDYCPIGGEPCQSVCAEPCSVAKQATPHKTLIAQLMDSRVPKTEREHAAVREIERLLGAASEPAAWINFNAATGERNVSFVCESELASIPLWPEPPRSPRKPLTDEEIEKAYREIWRNLPSDFDHTSSEWIEAGIRYAERVHGIGEQK